MVQLSAMLLLLRVFYLVWFTPYGLAPDEAQYWSWLQHNDLSFLTKPPLTTWVMGLSTWLLGNTLLGVKWFALLGQLAVPLLGAALAREAATATHKGQAGWWAFGLLTTLPLVAAGGLIMAPDALLLPLWLAGLLVLIRAVDVPPARALCWGRWVLLGVMIGLAGLAKYNAGLFFPLLGLYLLWQQPIWLRKPQPYAAGLIALAMQVPVIYWNFTNDFAGIKHVLWQAEGDSRHGGLESLADFIGSQALVLGPLGLMVLMGGWLWAAKQAKQAKAKTPPRIALLLVFTLPIFILFVGQSLTGKVQANWPLLATVPGLVLAAVWLAQVKLKRWGIGLLALGLVLNMGLSGALYNTTLLRPLLPLKTDPTKDLFGWAEMGELFGTLLGRLEDPLVLGVRYQTIAPLAFHTTPKIQWFYWNAEGRRAVDYDDWQWPASLPKRPVVLVKESPDFPIHLAELFTDCRPWHSLGTEYKGEVVRRLYTWVCWGYRAQRVGNLAP